MPIVPVLNDTETHRDILRQKAVEGVESLFPIVGRNYSIEVEKPRVLPKDYNLNDYKKAILGGKSLYEPVVGTVVLKDAGGKTVDRVNDFRLMNLPYFTEHRTFIVDGNSYSVANQLRTKPGIYTRIRRNEVPEVAFNLSKGANFKITMDPASSVFRMELGGSTVPLYPVLRSLGLSDSVIRKQWGTEILDKNTDISDSEYTQAIDKIYAKTVPLRDQSDTDDRNEKVRKIKNYFLQTSVDPETTMKTLGKGYKNVGAPTMLDASNKLLRVFREEVEHDDRDSLEFQRLMTVDDFVKERLQKGGRVVTNKVKFKMDNRPNVTGIRDVLPSSPLTDPVKTMVTQFAVSRPPDQINPMELMDAAAKVTRLGEGGIASIRAVPEDTRDLHTTHLGIIDPVRTPESSNIGIDVRLSTAAAKDEEGNIYTTVKDARTGKTKYVRVSDFSGKAIAFPGQDPKAPKVDIIRDGRIERVKRSEVDYIIPTTQSLFSPAASILPFIDNMQGNRALMGAKQVTQALPLKEREAPLVQASAPPKAGVETMPELVGRQIIRTAPEDGHISKVTDEYIYFRGKSGELHKIPYAKDFPLNSKTYIDEQVVVAPHTEVKAGTPLTESNFTRDGEVALGRNAKVAYMAYKGENSNDAIVISDSAAKKFTSMHMFKKVLEPDEDVNLSKKFWVTQFPNKLKKGQLEKLDSDGLPKKGEVFAYGEPIILASQKSSPSPTDQMLGKIHKSLVRKYKDASVTWDKETPGVITDVVKNGNRVTVTVKTEMPAVVGDKLSGSYGNKGVVSRIIPDEQMPHTEDGEPVEILIGPTGVVSRINPSQILETALGKVAKKTGKKIVIDNFDSADRLQQVKDTLKKHGVSDKETVIDPVTGKAIPGVFVGYQHLYKLFKSTDTNFGSRGIAGYDVNEQPTRGGDEGAKRIGGMELNALLAHGVPGIIEEVSTLKSQRNDDWWNAYRQGLPLPPVKRPFVVDKFNAMLAGAGIKVENKGDRVQLGAMTDQDIEKMSSGEIKRADTLRKKDLKPELGGLFDPLKTGGIEGEKWSHIELDEPVVKPVFEKPAASLLGMTKSALAALVGEYGGKAALDMLKKLDLGDLKKKTKDEIKTAKGQKLDAAVKRLKYIEGLEKTGLKPEDAYVSQKVLVLPPKMRPVVPGPNNQLLVADSNHLYRDILLANEKLKEMKDAGLTDPADMAPVRKDLVQSVAALSGLAEPASTKLRQQGKRGFIAQIAGTKPSEGMFQERIYGRPQDFSGRGTIAPDPSLGMDEIGLPEDTAWGMYKPFIIKKLVGLGYTPVEATREAEERSPLARRALDAETRDRPVLFNRAPSLHRYSVLAAYPKLVPGKTIRINPFSEAPLGADFDGDAIQLHVPVTPKGVAEARDITLDKLLFNEKTRNNLIAKPDMESVIGLFEATRMKPSGRKFTFKDKNAAMQAYYRGEITPTDEVVIGEGAT